MAVWQRRSGGLDRGAPQSGGAPLFSVISDTIPSAPPPSPGSLALIPFDKPGSPAPRPTLRREWLLLAISLILLLAIVVPPLVNLGRYQHRIVNTMSRSLGRQVTLRSVALRLLPMPALVLSDVVVEEQTGFGAEPALRAPSVIAQIRLTSLWRGRLEVSRVELSDASLNLVRDASGRWNVGSILLQASHVINAPTGQRRAGPAPRFPYIEIRESRINIKQGMEKLPYSLLNANLSMWLAEPEIWQIRLDGLPVRTDVDLGLADTGILRAEGRLHRATAFGHMPLAFHGEWSSAPLGQASRLLLGSDRGWRGDLHATADVSGDLDSLAIKTHIQVANLHREEFTPSEPFQVDATCHAAYSRGAQTLSDLGCRWPFGSGLLLLTGSIGAENLVEGTGLHSTLALTVQQLPASFLVAAAGLARRDFAPAFHLDGALNGMLFYTAQGGEAPVYAGVLEAPRLRLEAAGIDQPLDLTDARLAATTPSPAGISTLELSAAPVDLGGSTPTVINAQFTRQGFLLHASGSASTARLEALGRATHLLPAALAWVAPLGMAQFDVTRSAGWQPGDSGSPVAVGGPASGAHDAAPAAFATAAVTNGWLRLEDATYRPRFLPEGVTLATAQAAFLPGEVDWSVPYAVFHGISLQFNAVQPLDCSASQPCITHFHASCATLDGQTLVAALFGNGADQPLIDQLLRGLQGDSRRWPALDGTIHADTFTLGRLALHHADATLSILDKRATVRSLDAQALGGVLHAEGTMSIAEGAPRYTLSATITRASASAIGALFHENWGTGTLSASSALELAGTEPAQLAASAQGIFHVEWLRGGLGSLTPLARFALWTADGRVESQTLTLTQSELTTGSGGEPLPISGSIGFDRVLSLHLGAESGPKTDGADQAPSKGSVTVTGTLAQPAKPPKQED